MRFSLETVNATAEPVNVATVAFGRSAFRGSAHDQELLALFSNSCASGSTFRGFPVQGLRDGSRTTRFGERKNFDLEDSSFIGNAKTVATTDVAGGFGAMSVRFDATNVARIGCERARFEEPGGPKPFVDADCLHAFYLRTAKMQAVLCSLTWRSDGLAMKSVDFAEMARHIRIAAVL